MTPVQKKYADAIAEHGSIRKAADALNVNPRSIERALARAKKTEDDFTVNRRTTLHNAQGEVVLEWVRSDKDAKGKLSLMQSVADSFKDDLPRADRTTPPQLLSEDLLSLYVITDYHLGMYSWGEETGEDWDLAIAKETLMKWIDFSVNNSPNSETAVLAQLGDFLHWDGMEAVTPTSKHILDADTRFQKVVRTSIFLIRYAISKMLEKHNTLNVLIADANHDPASSVWLREWLAAHYENEPRVQVNQSSDSYYCYVFGDVSLFFHHGHLRKTTNIDHVFTSKFREAYGKTKYSYAHMGHLHHWDATETNLMIVEQHRTLAAKDAYSSRHGYMADRDSKNIIYHKKYGEISRLTVTPEMLK